jgi:hypothetical protein
MTPVTNRTAMPIYVGSTMIPAGETRHFPDDQVPEHLRPVAPADAAAPVVTTDAPPTDPMAVLLEGTVEDVTAQLGTLDPAQLDALDALEAAGKARKTLLAAIAEERLKRAGA